MMNEESSSPSSSNVVVQLFKRLGQLYQLQLDKWTPHTKVRWAAALGLVGLFLLRVFTKQGWYIVTYALGIYHLNLFIAFLTPKIDPALDLDDDQGPELPTKSNEEFRPFIRRLPEFKFWYAISKSTVIGIICTFFEMFNVPVFWPILLLYFAVLFCITMKRQIKHMIKYRYLPFTHTSSLSSSSSSSLASVGSAPTAGPSAAAVAPSVIAPVHPPAVAGLPSASVPSASVKTV
ncbi:AGAP011996-PA-like protein [Anopheles sinensis]|uniref:AGAP011996-PA-like protein n=1 Tax=Anopheles sinensis TaxID=74873 RepID=A0A084W4E6_ANOSI|nr:AGAP011996-PA-like protein [Anopheles sinensis]